ncbi:MAG: hypothetical protein J3K34DRAFT_115114 [Monoraphidium minutum]|nr:MAG: hypothetical protein J3K34DRAFT_115114 [Monoraphidium minutum]
MAVQLAAVAKRVQAEHPRKDGNGSKGSAAPRPLGARAAGRTAAPLASRGHGRFNKGRTDGRTQKVRCDCRRAPAAPRRAAPRCLSQGRGLGQGSAARCATNRGACPVNWGARRQTQLESPAWASQALRACATGARARCGGGGGGGWAPPRFVKDRGRRKQLWECGDITCVWDRGRGRTNCHCGRGRGTPTRERGGGGAHIQKGCARRRRRHALVCGGGGPEKGHASVVMRRCAWRERREPKPPAPTRRGRARGAGRRERGLGLARFDKGAAPALRRMRVRRPPARARRG